MCKRQKQRATNNKGQNEQFYKLWTQLMPTVQYGKLPTTFVPLMAISISWYLISIILSSYIYEACS